MRERIGHIEAIEGLRGVAVLWVIAFHYFILRSDRPLDPWIALVKEMRPLQVVVGNGYLGVDLFFLITGFLLTLPWLHAHARGAEAPSAWAFYRRRVLRIVPAYYVHLGVLFFLVVPLVLGPEFWMRNLWFTLENLGAHLAFVHYFTPVTSASLGVNGALWTLALEAQYYLLLPLLAPWIARRPAAVALGLIAVALAWRWEAAHGMPALVAIESRLGAPWKLPEPTIRHLLATQLPGYLAHFALGILAGRAWLLGLPAGTPRARFAWVAAAMASLVFLYGVHGFARKPAGEFTWLLVPLAMAVAIHALVTKAPGVGALLLANRPLAFTGKVSYSAYLYHLPLLLLWNRFVPESGWAGLPLYLAASLATAWVSYRFVEQPFLQAKRLPEGTTQWPTNAVPGALEARLTSPITTGSGAAPSTTTASSSNS